jgi:hypothetical protein
VQTGLLPRFFESVTRQAFGDLAIDDAPALRYLSDLLTRFVRTEAIRSIRELPTRRLDPASTRARSACCVGRSATTRCS